MKRLEDYGFLFPRAENVASGEEAVAVAERLGYPVVLKVISPDLVHRTEAGGVQIGLCSGDAVRRAYREILASVKKTAPTAQIAGIRVEEMCQAGHEVIIGLHRDEQFGLVIMFGLGGIYTQVFQDVSFRLLPLTEQDAAEMVEGIRGREILRGFRGQPPVATESLVNLLMKANRVGQDLADQLGSVDLNPIAVWGQEHRVLDAKLLLRPAMKSEPTAPPQVEYLERFFAPKSVALIGASLTPGKIGNAVLDSLVRHEYRGRVYPVNPGHKEMMGLPAYPALSEIPDSPEVVIVTVALEKVPAILDECASKGIHNMIIISGGGKELGEKGGELERRIGEKAKEMKIRVVGCNCIGVFDGQSRFDSFFQTHERMVRPKDGPIALLTQSGTVGAAFLELAQDLGVSRFVSYGNRVDVDEADLLGFLENDARTRVIACYVEGFRDGRKFISAARRVAERKPVVIYKAGRSARAATASMSHTGFLGGTYAVTKGACRQARLITVDSFDDLAAVVKALAMQSPAKGNRVAMIGNGAGTMVQAIDLLDEYALELIALGDESRRRLIEVFPPFYLVGNPVDVTGSATSEDYERGIETLMKDPNVDLIMPWIVFQDTPLQEDIAERLGRLSKRGGKPIVVGAIGGPYTRTMSEAIERVGVPVYHSVRQWVAAAHGLSQASRGVRLGAESVRKQDY